MISAGHFSSHEVIVGSSFLENKRPPKSGPVLFRKAGVEMEA